MSDDYQINVLSSKGRHQAIRLTRDFWSNIDFDENYLLFLTYHNNYFEPVSREKFWEFVDTYINPNIAKKISEYLIEGGEYELDARVEGLEWNLSKNKIKGTNLNYIIDPYAENILNNLYNKNDNTSFEEVKNKYLSTLKPQSFIEEQIYKQIKNYNIQQAKNIFENINDNNIVLDLEEEQINALKMQNSYEKDIKDANKTIYKIITKILSQTTRNNIHSEGREYLNKDENLKIIINGFWNYIEDKLDIAMNKTNLIVEATKTNNLDYIEIVSKERKRESIDNLDILVDTSKHTRKIKIS